ncbi:MAG: uncharacterized membrane protein YjgN (DUF898 family) [Cellvibrionaceae bacterium]
MPLAVFCCSAPIGLDNSANNYVSINNAPYPWKSCWETVLYLTKGNLTMQTLRFEGSGFEYFKVWIVNILLTIVTLGIYHPWAKVRNLRYLYGNTALDDRNFDYHATGKQIFLSYLIAMLSLIVFVTVQQIWPIGSTVLVVLLFLCVPWIIWRSLMFNMRMTSFSNVRFSFDGSPGQAYINFLWLPLLMLLCFYGGITGFIVLAILIGPNNALSGTLGGMLIVLSLALVAYLFGLIKKRHAMYIANGTCYGQGRFSTQLQTIVFVKILLKTVALSLLLFLAYILMIAIFAYLTIGLAELQVMMLNLMPNSPNKADGLGGAIVLIIFLVYLGLLALFFLGAAYFHVRQRNYIVDNTLFDEKTVLGSTLRAWTFAWVMLSNFLLIVLTLGLATPWAQVRVLRLTLENTQVDTEVDFDNYITQQQQYQSSLGDQLGDAFDVDAGLAI